MNLFGDDPDDWRKHPSVAFLFDPRPPGIDSEVADQKIDWRCKCGEKWTGLATRSAVPYMKRQWAREHEGAGHGMVVDPKVKRK